MARVQEDVGEAKSHDRVKAAIEGLLVNYYTTLGIGDDEHAAGYYLLARRVRESYDDETKMRAGPLKMASLEDIDKEIRSRAAGPGRGCAL